MHTQTLKIITQAVLPMKERAMTRAATSILDRIDQMLWDLEHLFQMDREKMAPYPSSMRCTRVQYMAQKAEHEFLGRITKGKKFARSFGEPDICERDEPGIKREVERAKEMAALAFEAYAVKLALKIGPNVVKASALSVGDDLWMSSQLKAFTEDQDFTVWNTKTIVNCSKLGKLFFQFPTRKGKSTFKVFEA